MPMRPSVACAKRADGGAAWLDRRRAGCFWVVAACLAALPVAPAAAAPAAGSAPAASSVRAVPAASAAPAAPASTGLGAATAIDPTASVDPVPAEPGARLRELDPEALDAAAVRDVLSHVPAPRILLFQGSVPLVTMAPVAEFLIAMGYPAAQLADPRTGGYSRSSFADASRLAGEVAWHYERDGMRPLLIGHSQGGMIAIRILHELAGGFRDELPVWDPVSDAPLPRTTIVDPLTGAERPVVGLSVSYASALATGMLPRLMLGQWDMIRRLHDIPDSVDEFVGFVLPFDPIAGTLGGGAPYAASGRAQVRNVTLPASYRHIGLPDIAHLAADPVTREWIERYTPTASLPPPDAEADTTNLLHAAILWHDVKKHWCIESQRLRAARVRLAGGT
jgi:hypothetical protein